MFIPHQPYMEQNRSYRSVKPAPGTPLADVVWEIYQADYDAGRDIIFPDICADLMVFYTCSGAYAFMAGGDPMLTTMAKFDFLPETRSIFGVKFCTGSMGNLCLQDVTDMGSCLVTGEDALNGGREMIRALLETESFGDRVDIVTGWIEKKLNFGYEVNAITHFIALDVIKSHGQAQLSELVEETGYSERYLRLVLRERMGTTYRQLCQITRFQWAYHLYQDSDGTMPFSILAAECGYYDQSHMNSSIKKLTGRLPRKVFTLYRQPGSTADFS